MDKPARPGPGAFQGPCREPPCPRRREHYSGYCKVHAISRLRGARPLTPAEVNPPFQGPCAVWGCANRITGAHGLCETHVRKPYRRIEQARRQAIVRAFPPESLAGVFAGRLRNIAILNAALHEGRTPEEIANAHGVSRQRISQILGWMIYELELRHFGKAKKPAPKRRK